MVLRLVKKVVGRSAVASQAGGPLMKDCYYQTYLSHIFFGLVQCDLCGPESWKFAFSLKVVMIIIRG